VLAASDEVEFIAEISITAAAKEMNQYGRKSQEYQRLVVSEELGNGIRRGHGGSSLMEFFATGYHTKATLRGKQEPVTAVIVAAPRWV
jgi:hypothetical protein